MIRSVTVAQSAIADEGQAYGMYTLFVVSFLLASASLASLASACVRALPSLAPYLLSTMPSKSMPQKGKSGQKRKQSPSRQSPSRPSPRMSSPSRQPKGQFGDTASFGGFSWHSADETIRAKGLFRAQTAAGTCVRYPPEHSCRHPGNFAMKLNF